MTIIMPEGALGGYEGEPTPDSFLRDLAVATCTDPAMDWPSKYGTDINTAVFSMHSYCYCEEDSCPWCGPGCTCTFKLLLTPDGLTGPTETMRCEVCTVGWGCEQGGTPGKAAPNFWHKPSDFKVWWYKYIGRSMETEGPMPTDFEALLMECLESIP